MDLILQPMVIRKLIFMVELLFLLEHYQVKIYILFALYINLVMILVVLFGKKDYHPL
mgnify:CR=1 FL=1